MAEALLTPLGEESLGNQRMLYFPAPGNPPLRAGQVISGHVHSFHHVMVVFYGGIRIELLDAVDTPERQGVELEEREVWGCGAGGNPRQALHLVRRGEPHRLTVLQDGTVYGCLYASRNPDGSMSEDWTGWPGEIGTR